ncbi:hypothetical protein FQN50_004760 [Emmonsiellopsis sp. PD_5]|nr:hypothetical protein FQN50_004760 [Emmonsiellopsis sp. PD_5]
MVDAEDLDRSEVMSPSEESSQTKFPLDGYDISKVSNETLTALFETAPVLHWYEGTRIVRLSQTLVLKGGINARPCEANILNLVSEKCGSLIAVPKVHRVLNVETEDVFFGCKCLIVMDFIAGRLVKECWEQLCEPERVDVVTQVASMITTLHSIPVPQQPGPVGCRTCLARGYWFPDIGAGPFDSKEDLEAWFNHRLAICKHFKQAPDAIPPFHFDKLVLTHHDIAPRNLILYPNGKVVLIDWGDAGIYPKGLEATSLNVRRFTTPEFTNMLLEMIPKHEEMTWQLTWTTFALTTGQYL